MKDSHTDRNKKIIPFPNLAELLQKKGMEAMEEKNFKQASTYFAEAYDLKPDNEDINIGLALSLVEIGDYQEAKTLVKEMMGKGIGDYFHVINIYLMILLQLNEHKEIVTVVEALLEENQVPANRVESLQHLLNMSKRIVDQGDEESNNYQSGFNPISNDELNEVLDSGSIEEQLFILSSLTKQNIRPWVERLSHYLIEDKHPFLKTIVLNLLSEQDVDTTVTVEKLGQTISVSVNELPKVEESPFILEVEKELSRLLEDNNPIMFEQALEMAKRHNILLYPLVISNPADWANAYHYIILEAYHMDEEDPEEHIRPIMQQIRELEGISFPVI